jgi:hypothetical protein
MTKPNKPKIKIIKIGVTTKEDVKQQELAE